MTRREISVLRRSGRSAAVLAAVFLFAAAAVAVASSGRATVTTHKGKLGKMLAASNGHTLYMFTGDKSSKSSCYQSCASTWHPLLTHGKPVAAHGSGVNGNVLHRTHRTGGGTQVTYNGHPLYLYTGDQKAGQLKGENLKEFGGRWYAVNVKGNALKPKQSGGGGGSCPPNTPGGCY